MSKRKGFMIETLDTATSKMQGRDKAYESMVNQTLNIIPEAIAMKDSIENERKKRLAKAKRLQTTFNLPSLDAAKEFLNEYDPDGTQTTLQLQKVFEQLRFTTNQNIIDQTNTTGGMPTGFIAGSQSMSLPTDVSKGFDKYIGMPTIGDAIVGAEEKLGLSAGTGRDALNFVNPANIGPDPYRFQTSGAYSFSAESTRVGEGALNDEKIITGDWITAVGGTAKADGTVAFNPYSIKAGARGEDFEFDDQNYGPWIGAFDTVSSDVNRFRRNLNNVLVGNTNDNNELKISEGVGEIVAGISEANRLVAVSPVFKNEDGTTDFENLKHLYSHDQSGALKQSIENSKISIPYAGIYNVLTNNNGITNTTDLKEIQNNPSLIENSVPRPQYNIGQLRALQLDKNYDTKKLTTTYKGKVMSVEDAQADWDAEENIKLKFLTKHIGERATQTLVSGVYGTGTYSTIHDNIDDGVAGSQYDKNYIGSENVAEQRLVTILRKQGVQENTIKAMTVDKASNLLQRNIIDKKDLSFGYEKGWILTGVTLTGDDPDAKAPRVGYVKDYYRWYDIRTGRMYDSEGNIIKPKKSSD
tara:strand:+ start:1220 stop:2968 length:1749 start_codon:yes stop_codon:yes gene_type:complete